MLTPDQAAELTGLIHAFEVSECYSADDLRRMGALLPEAAPEQIAEAQRAATKRNHWPREAESQAAPRGVTVPAVGHITGRNGTWNITALAASPYGKWVDVDGIGKSGNAINGGLTVQLAAFTRLCVEFLQGLGYAVQAPRSTAEKDEEEER